MTLPTAASASASAAAAAAAAAAAGGIRSPAISLQSLSHPLLLADYKAKKQRLEHQLQMSSTAAATSGSRKGGGRMLGTRKEVMAR
jgi:hypothetical protein